MRGHKYSIQDYFCWSGAAGTEVEVGAAFTSLTLLEAAFGINTVENKQRITTAAASIQVPFSRTSVVCLTPMNWLLNPATFPARPPPFGF